jgi:hypothetical protein
VWAIHNPEPAAGDCFGWSIAAVGDKVIIGSPYHDEEGIVNAGAAYLFDPSSPGSPICKYLEPQANRGINRYFGYALAGSGDNIVVGTGTAGSGAAYLFGPPSPPCPCKRFSTSDFGEPMGKKKQLGSTLPVKFRLFFDDDDDPVTPPDEVTGQEELNDILTANGCQPDSPHIAIYEVTDTEDVELPEDPNNVGEGGDLGDSFRYSDGNWIFNLGLPSEIYWSGREYKVTVRIGECELTPGNNLFEIK